MSILKKDYRSTIMAKFNYLSILFIHSIKKRFRITFVAGLAIVLTAMSLVSVFSGVPVAAADVHVVRHVQVEVLDHLLGVGCARVAGLAVVALVAHLAVPTTFAASS